MGRVDEDWRANRRAAAEAHAEALARSEAARSARAGELLAAFAGRALEAGVPVTRLVARSHKGTGRFKTDVVGWYLRRDGSLGVDRAGSFFILEVPGGLSVRFRKSHLDPSPPPLVVGKGGRDGESFDLEDLLALRLAAGADWPGR
jgi:hypothetical protein